MGSCAKPKPKSKKAPTEAAAASTSTISSTISCRGGDGGNSGGKNYVFLNTKGVCLLCFEDCDQTLSEDTRNENLQTSVKFCRLTSRYLSFNLGKIVTTPLKKFGRSCKSVYKTVEQDKPRDKPVGVELCERCTGLANEFCKLHFQVEFHQMTLDRCVRSISEVIREADKKSKRALFTISEDEEALSKQQETFTRLTLGSFKSAYKLRNKLYQQSLAKLSHSFPLIRLRRICKSGDWISILNGSNKNGNGDSNHQESKKTNLSPAGTSEAVVGSLMGCLVSFWIVLSLSFINPDELKSKEKIENLAGLHQRLTQHEGGIIISAEETGQIPVEVLNVSQIKKKKRSKEISKEEVKKAKRGRPCKEKRKTPIVDDKETKKNGIKRTKIKDVTITHSATVLEAPVSPKDVQVQEKKTAQKETNKKDGSVSESLIPSISRDPVPQPVPTSAQPFIPANQATPPVLHSSTNSSTPLNPVHPEVRPLNHYSTFQPEYPYHPQSSGIPNPQHVTSPYPYYGQQPTTPSHTSYPSSHQYNDTGYYYDSSPSQATSNLPPTNSNSSQYSYSSYSFTTFNYDSQSQPQQVPAPNSSWPMYNSSSAIPSTSSHNSYAHSVPSTSHTSNEFNYDAYYGAGKSDHYNYANYDTNGPYNSPSPSYYYPNLTPQPQTQSQPQSNNSSDSFTVPPPLPPPVDADTQYTSVGKTDTPSPPLTHEEPKHPETGEGVEPKEQLQGVDGGLLDENDDASRSKHSSEFQALSIFPEVHWRQQQQNAEKIPCSVSGCTEQFIRKDHLELHLKAHGTFQCNFCHLSFSKAHSLALHEKGRHGKSGSTGSNKNKCSRCDFSSSSQNNFFIHFLGEHLNIQIYGQSCNICKKKFITGARNYVIRNHFKNYHDTKGKNPDSIFKCKGCNAPFLKELQMKDHYSYCVESKVIEDGGYEDPPRAPSTVSSIDTVITFDTAFATADRLAV